MNFLVYSSGFCIMLAVTIQWKWPTSDFDLGLIKKKFICNFEIGNWHVYSLKFFLGMYILKDTKFLCYKALKLFLLYIKHWINPAVKFKCSFPIYVTYTPPLLLMPSFCLSLNKILVGNGLALLRTPSCKPFLYYIFMFVFRIKFWRQSNY